MNEIAVWVCLFFVDYGLVGQPSAPQREENQTKQTAIEFMKLSGAESMKGMKTKESKLFCFCLLECLWASAAELVCLFCFFHLYWRGEGPQQPRKREKKIKRRAARPSEAPNPLKKKEERLSETFFCVGYGAEPICATPFRFINLH